MSFTCPIHGYFTPISGATVALCPQCSSRTGSESDVARLVRERDEARAQRDELRDKYFAEQLNWSVQYDDARRYRKALERIAKLTSKRQMLEIAEDQPRATEWWWAPSRIARTALNETQEQER